MKILVLILYLFFLLLSDILYSKKALQKEEIVLCQYIESNYIKTIIYRDKNCYVYSFNSKTNKHKSEIKLSCKKTCKKKYDK